jgi:hypothetical protein
MEAKMRSAYRILHSVTLRHVLLPGAFILVTVAVVLLASRSAGAQDGFAIPWYTMDNGGGGPVTGGPFGRPGRRQPGRQRRPVHPARRLLESPLSLRQPDVFAGGGEMRE